jgi:colanic acid/amylovoran biosynthesis glycosyltransferase
MILVLLTNSFPYDDAAEHTFIRRELPHLRKAFDRVILMPKVCRGKKLSIDPGIELDESYAKFFERASRIPNLIFRALTSRHLYREWMAHPEILLFPFKLLKLVKFSGQAEVTRQWVRDWLVSLPVDHDGIVFYTYWFEEITTGIALEKHSHPRTTLISRAHGYDIYEEHYFPYYWPSRPFALKALDRLFFVSDAGRNYMDKRYHEFAAKFETARLGIEDPGFTAHASSDGIFRIVSCAHIVPVKRIGLLLDGIAAAARTRPGQTFEWTHFGGGAGLQSLASRMAREFPSNAQGYFPGNVSSSQIMQHYQEHPVDVYLNVSSTEGLPVAIQEAISCGIPVIATSVGGNPEVVSEKNGILLSADPQPSEIASALLKIRDDPVLAARMRIESRRLWERSYNAEVNFRLFAERLKAIGER